MKTFLVMIAVLFAASTAQAVCGFGPGGVDCVMEQTQVQAQEQQQQQKQQQSSTNLNTNIVAPVQMVKTSADASSSAGASAPTTVSNNTTYNEKYQAPAVIAPGLAASPECIGSWSAGGSGPWFGISFGSTRTHEGCERRRNAEMLDKFGFRDAAILLLMKDADVAEAMQRVGFVPPPAAKSAVVKEEEKHLAGYPLIQPKP